MKLVCIEDVDLGSSGPRLQDAMQECVICNLPMHFHEQIAIGRKRKGYGATRLTRFLVRDCKINVTFRAVGRHIESHIDEEGLCLRSDRRPSKTSTATKAKSNKSARS